MENNIYFCTLEMDDYKTSIHCQQNDEIWEKYTFSSLCDAVNKIGFYQDLVLVSRLNES